MHRQKLQGVKRPLTGAKRSVSVQNVKGAKGPVTNLPHCQTHQNESMKQDFKIWD